MKTKIYSLFAILTLSVTAWSQGVGINETGSNPNPSAILDVESTDKGFLPPRMTSVQRNGITSPATGLIVYNTDDDCIQVNNGTPATPTWECLEAKPEFQNIRGKFTATAASTYTIAADDFYVITTGTGTQITFPNSGPGFEATDAGRVVYLQNDNSSVTANTWGGTLPEGNILGVNNRYRGGAFLFTGTKWILLSK